MLTLYYAPQSRATRINVLLHAMGMRDKVRLCTVDILRVDGGGRTDPRNPHPEAKVPALDTGHGVMTESNAIMLFLTDHFDSPLGRGIGHPDRGAYLTWLGWAAGVVEPWYVANAGGHGNEPLVRATWRGEAEIADRIETALARGPWLLGERYSAADILVASVWLWAPDWAPDRPALRDWLARCAAHPSQLWANAQDRVMLAA